MELDGSLPHSQVPAIACLQREVAENFLGEYAAGSGKNYQCHSLPSAVNLQQFAQEWGHSGLIICD